MKRVSPLRYCLHRWSLGSAAAYWAWWAPQPQLVGISRTQKKYRGHQILIERVVDEDGNVRKQIRINGGPATLYDWQKHKPAGPMKFAEALVDQLSLGQPVPSPHPAPLVTPPTVPMKFH